MSGFTMAYNPVLRDKTLSLTAKGLYLVISSFIGMPRWSLTKGTLAKYCESRYALEKAWRELQAAGYLKHRFFQFNGTGSFVHIYDLLQIPDNTPAYQYINPCDRHNGDCRLVSASDTPRDFTRIPNTVLRSTVLSLAVKGLFSVVSHLANIPNFHLHPDGVKSFCVERLKRFSSVWQHLKISGLLKQHRYPTGEDNSFTYSYDLLNEPDQETPYLTNHHADGSVSSEKTIAEYLQRAKKKLKALRTAVCATKPRRAASNTQASNNPSIATYKAYTPSEAERNDIGERIGRTYLNQSNDSPIATYKAYTPSEAERKSVGEGIGYTSLKQSHDPTLVDLIVDALTVIANAPQLTISKCKIPLAQRAELIRRVTYDEIEHFINTTRINLSRAKHPAAYLRTILYSWLQKQDIQPPECRSGTVEWCNQRQQQMLNKLDQDWLERVQAYRKETRRRRLAEEAELNKGMI